MCQSIEDEIDSLSRRHREFHKASRVINTERLWTLDPAQYNDLRRAGEAVRAAKYEKQPSRKVEDVETGDSL